MRSLAASDQRPSRHLTSRRFVPTPFESRLHRGGIAGATLIPFMPIVQAKLRIGAPSDQYEREAERVAGEVMHMAKSPVGPDALPVTPVGQRESNGSSSHGEAPPVVRDVLSSPGRQLDSNARDYMEQRLACDFSRVRVHTDGQAAASARALHARAYTVGHDVVFGQGQYAPTTKSGKHLLAHEMTHVLQQENSAPSIMKLGLDLGGCAPQPQSPSLTCGQPLGYEIGPGTAVLDSHRFGMGDSPRVIAGSLAGIQVKELISQIVDHYSFLSWDEMNSEADPYVDAEDLPDDNHLFPIEVALKGYDKYVQENGPVRGTISFLQMYIYKCDYDDPTTLPRAVPHSGYRITHTLRTTGPYHDDVVATTSKQQEKVTIFYEGRRYDSGPGLTAQIRPVRNLLRLGEPTEQ